MNTFFDHLTRCWRGEENLCRVFWFWGAFVGNILMAVLLSFLVPALMGLLSLVEMARMTVEDMQMQGFTPEMLGRAQMMQAFEVLALPFALGAWLSYFVWHFVSVWRSARKCSCPASAAVARFTYLVVSVTYFGLLLFAACKMFAPIN